MIKFLAIYLIAAVSIMIAIAVALGFSFALLACPYFLAAGIILHCFLKPLKPRLIAKRNIWQKALLAGKGLIKSLWLLFLLGINFPIVVLYVLVPLSSWRSANEIYPIFLSLSGIIIVGAMLCFVKMWRSTVFNSGKVSL